MRSFERPSLLSYEITIREEKSTKKAPCQDFVAQSGVVKSCMPKSHFHAQEIEHKRDSHVQHTPNNFPTKAIHPYALLARSK